ncbi:MAG TPA: uroporphyrinogen decarboxylase family protein [Dehalococcoidales bacterium]|nr:uroporphyrinogen decarboxylase family protein [Dehalococcoidales bacterium]
MAKTGVTAAKKWSEMTWQERREERFKRWLYPRDVKFVSPAAEKSYKERVTRFIKAIKLEEPDRVPCILPAGSFPAYHAGTTLRHVMYDYDALRDAWKKFLNEFDGDTYSSPGVVPSARVSEIIDSKTTRWPGHGLTESARFQQFVEGEYMKADEYDRLIDDPSDYCLRCYIPRSLGALEPFAKLMPFSHLLGMPTRLLGACTLPEVQEAFLALVAAGRELAKYQEVIRQCGREGQAAGFPLFHGGMSQAPFDTFADTLRGTRGIVLDMYRQPEKLFQAMERVTPLNISLGVDAANLTGGPIVFIPLHKGDDTFMSDKQFDTFYWPTLRKLVLGLVEEGCVPLLFAEGRYNRRLKQITDLPRGSVLWHFDQTDMAEAKTALGGNVCISGNVPTSLLITGTAAEVKEYCRRLIEVCAPGGGFILTGGASIDSGKAENLHAMMEAAREYGRYK